jgi:hypothetical protein
MTDRLASGGSEYAQKREDHERQHRGNQDRAEAAKPAGEEYLA